MQAFLNDPALKSFVVTTLEQHKAADQIIHGSYWANGKGCAVGCTLEAVRMHRGDKKIDHSDHELFEDYLGIPRALARLEDRIFEGMTNGHSQEWPLRFANAIQPGADLSMVVPNFLFWLLSERLPKHVNKEKFPKTWQSIADVADLYREWCVDGMKPSRERFEEARAKCHAYADAAYADAAYADAAYAADAAAAYAADADAAAAYAYAAAAYAADADADAAYAYAADADAYADAAASRAQAARSAEYVLMADKLVELLAAAPIKAPEAQAAE